MNNESIDQITTGILQNYQENKQHVQFELETTQGIETYRAPRSVLPDSARYLLQSREDKEIGIKKEGNSFSTMYIQGEEYKF
jgi:hypothetical protein